jgi:methylenetetrahydrofolate dehydrogenase (NADP+) / methenyltetrahydrofolate cyclohydrolase
MGRSAYPSRAPGGAGNVPGMENLIDGKAVAAQVRAEVGARVRALQERTGVQCGLATVMVGDDPASAVYVGNKHRACHEAGMASFDIHLAGDIDQDGLHAKIDEVCNDPRIHGMIVQLPLPPHLDEDAALDRIVYTKDADGLTPAAQGRLATLRPGPRPATPNGVVELLRRYDVELTGAHAVIVGRSEIVGKPQAHLLLEQNCTVTICHSRTRDLPSITRQADVLVAAVGRPEMLTGEHVRDGAVVIDVGMNRLPDGLCGDVDFAAVQPKARLITPVPGGVGPMTIAMLMKNTVRAAAQIAGV